MEKYPVQNISILESLPAEWGEELLPGIQEANRSSKYKIVILDDDPTGTQTARDIPVLTHWSVDALRDELVSEYPAFFILTNSRSLTESAAIALAREIGTSLNTASELTGIRTILISRSDSTLRGHFPAEVDAMAEVTGKSRLPYLILPFFLEGGRYTINDIHYVQEKDQLIPAGQTPFARDAAFGFSNSNLPLWVEEKSRGKIPAASVVSITLKDIRCGGPKKVIEKLESVPEKTACIVNAASYRDMEVFVTSLLDVEGRGWEFLYRTAASFVRTRTGLDHHAPLLRSEGLTSTTENGGLFIIGSYVEKSSRQVNNLLNNSDILGLEVLVERLLKESTRKTEISRVANDAVMALESGKDCAVYTSRKLISGTDAGDSLSIGKTVSDSLIEIVRSVKIQPRYLVAKGGITSSDVATKGLGVKRAMVAGQAMAGVPVWTLGFEARFPGMPFVIFPGNVGDDDALTQLKNSLRGK